jgi:hypothetical protein
MFKMSHENKNETTVTSNFHNYYHTFPTLGKTVTEDNSQPVTALTTKRQQNFFDELKYRAQFFLLKQYVIKLRQD